MELTLYLPGGKTVRFQNKKILKEPKTDVARLIEPEFEKKYVENLDKILSDPPSGGLEGSIEKIVGA